jgi:cytoskeleton protein RodZ
VNEASDPRAPEGAGAVLHAERRRQSMSLGDVSRQLKLSVRQVEALERDDFEPFGGPVFVHGFLRNYAKLLGLDPEPLLRAADEKLAPLTAPPPIEPEAEVVRRPRSSRKGLLGAIAGLALVGIVLGLLGLNERRGPPTEVADSEVGAAAPVVSQRAPAQAQAPTAEQAAGASSEPIRVGVVRMVFEQESWVEIRDRAGNTIFGQLNPAGSRRRASGEPPLSIVIGNAAGVRLTYNDEDVDLAPHTRVDVARLTLD